MDRLEGYLAYTVKLVNALQIWHFDFGGKCRGPARCSGWKLKVNGVNGSKPSEIGTEIRSKGYSVGQNGIRLRSLIHPGRFDAADHVHIW